jgi:hypothetical protein
MAYFGQQPIQSTYLTNYFSGTGSQTAFTLSRAPVNAASILVFITGVKQHASTYGVNGTTLTFSAAPPSGTNNIEVMHLGIVPDTVTNPSYRTITEFTATAGQTVFATASYTVGYIDVYRNGVKLGNADFTATDGVNVVLSVAAGSGDIVRTESFLITSIQNAIQAVPGSVSNTYLANGAVTQAKLNGGIAGTGPAFSAYGAAAQSISAGVVTKIQYNTEVFDTNSNYDNATNYRFTPTVAGYYQVNAYLSVIGAFSGSNTFTNLYIYKNGTQVAVGGTQPSNNNYSMMNVSSVIYCNGATDYIEIYHTSAVNTTVVTGLAWNGFSAALARAA